MINKIFIVFILLLSMQMLEAQHLPEKFTQEELISIDDIELPIGVTFDEKGQGYVWTKGGIIYLMNEDGSRSERPFIDISEEVGNFWDHGLAGFTLDPNFYNNGYVYLLYCVDRHHLLYYGTNQYHQDSSEYNNATIGRLTRYTADPNTNFKTIIPESRKILIGETVDSGFPVLIPFHGVGSIAFSEDGSLLISNGDASNESENPEDNYFDQAVEDGIVTGRNIGVYRSQDLTKINGKILRVNPQTGAGYPSNPFYEEGDPFSVASRTWAFGLRNAFRFTIKPGTGGHDPSEGQPGVIMIGDVGSGSWEELNISKDGGENFGWPIYEGLAPRWRFFQQQVENESTPNPLFGEGCDKAFFNYQDLISQELESRTDEIINPCDDFQFIPESAHPKMHTRPKVQWANKNWNFPERAKVGRFNQEGLPTEVDIEEGGLNFNTRPFGGYSSIAGDFYSGETFPEEYHGAYFHADHSQWIRVFKFDSLYNVTGIDSFHNSVWGITNIEYNPHDECMYFSNIFFGIYRICYGGNVPPIAEISADKDRGISPLQVQFDATASFDPNDDEIAFEWDFGNGMTSTEAQPSMEFVATGSGPEKFEVILSVKDEEGLIGTSEFIVSLNNTAPEVKITTVSDGDQYPTSGVTLLGLQARVRDNEHEKEELQYKWETFLHHNTHFHPDRNFETELAEIVLQTYGCGTEPYWYRIRLEVTDADGLSGVDEVEIFPYCGPPLINFLKLDGIGEETKVNLNFEVSDEAEITLYEVERSIDNGRTFNKIGELINSNMLNYNFDDLSPVEGEHVYRIKAYSNAVFDYSPEKKIKWPPDPDFELYPNPAISFFEFAINQPDESTSIYLYNSMGIEVLNKTFDSNNLDRFIQKIPVDKLLNGSYFYSIESGDKKRYGNIIILKN